MTKSHPPALNIRHAVAADAADIVTMIGELADFHADISRVDINRFKLDAFGFQPWFSVLVAEQDGALLGYAILNRIYKAQKGERGLDLHHLYVRETARNQGIGQRLVTAALAEAKALDCGFLTLGVKPYNEKARAFYARLGFADAASTNLRLKLNMAA